MSKKERLAQGKQKEEQEQREQTQQQKVCHEHLWLRSTLDTCLCVLPKMNALLLLMQHAFVHIQMMKAHARVHNNLHTPVN